MRSLISLCLLLPTLAFAVPVDLVHSGRLFDSSGIAVDGDQALTLTLYDAASGGASLWTETQPVVPFDNGYFAVTLGAVNALDDSVLDRPELWLTVSHNGTETGALRVASVPYARLAGTASSVNGGMVNASELRIDGNLVIDGSGTFQGSGTLAALGCSSGQLAAYVTDAWVCADSFGDADVLRVIGLSDANNSMNHARYTDSEAVTALAPHTSDAAAHHSRYADSEAVTALAPHTSDAAAHHARYADSDAVSAVSAVPLTLTAGLNVAGDLVSTGPHTADTTLGDADVDSFVTNGDLALSGTLNGLRMAAGQASFTWHSCGDTVGSPCIVNLASAGFTAAPACTISMVNMDATGYRETMMIKNITTTELRLWRGLYDSNGTTMVLYWTCMGS